MDSDPFVKRGPGKGSAKLFSNFFENFSPEKAYVLGFIWGDGHVSSDHVEVKASRDDLNEIYFLFEKFGFVKKDVKMRERQSKEASELNIFGQNLAKQFLNFGFKDKSHSSPDELLKVIPEDLHPYWFRGYFDADGCITMNKFRGKCKRFTIASSLNQDWSFCEEVLNKLSVKFSIRRYVGKRGSGSSLSSFGRENIWKFHKFIYGSGLLSFGLSRKRIKFMDVLNYCNIRVRNSNKKFYISQSK